MTSSRSWLPPFLLIWTGQAFSLIGSGIAQFALIWWLTATTGSATVLATAALVGLLPGILLGPFAGALVDRWNRRLVMMASDAIGALGAAVLALLFFAGAIQIWHVYLVMALRAVCGAFQWPAMQASTSLMVPDQQLARVAGMNQSIQGAVNILTPLLGATLLAVLPLHAIMAIDVVTAALAVLPLAFVSIPQPSRAEPAGTAAAPSLWGEVAAGMRYVWSWPGLLLLLLLSTVLNLLLGPAFTLVPILVTRHFGGGAIDLAWMQAAESGGLLLGGLLLTLWGGFRRRIFTALVGLLGLGIGSIMIGLAPANAFNLGLVGMVIVGVMGPITNGPFMAIMQAVVAPEMQGRVFTLLGSFSSAMMPLGLLVAGPVADALGVQVWYIVGGAASLLIAVACFALPAIRFLEDRPAERTEPPGHQEQHPTVAN
jgi:DHA3 family macrolide efflux protein-like MFS transporter